MCNCFNFIFELSIQHRLTNQHMTASSSLGSSISGILTSSSNLSSQTTASTRSNTNTNTNTNASVGGSSVYNCWLNNHTCGSFSFTSNTKTSPTHSMDVFNVTPNNSMSTLDHHLTLLVCFVLLLFLFLFCLLLSVHLIFWGLFFFFF